MPGQAKKRRSEKAAAAPKRKETPRAARAGARKQAAGGPSLVVVESPAKARTIKKYLGPTFEVKASVGHVKDLPKSKMGVDIEKGFLPEYDVIKGKAKVLAEIKRAARAADRVFLATDPDREGEAIAWHIAEEIGAGGGDDRVRRVLFNEITRNAIQKAMEHPLALDQKKFDSQQARRILDRLVGYKISPILWSKVKRGLSAGRVQSVAVRLVVDREREIEAFRPEEYWSLDADLAAQAPPEFRARLVKIRGQKAELKDRETTHRLLGELEGEEFVVAAVERRERRRNPPPPFTTAKLQQEAANRLGFTTKKTMTLAQRLYEGVDLGDEGAVGLITYMRTDSVRLSAEAVDAARGHIAARYGADHLPAQPNFYRTRQKAAQEAHEAVRPTSMEWTPERVEPYFEQMGDREMFRLYQLIWDRFVACQMVPAVYDQTTVDVVAGPSDEAVPGAGRATFRATGSVLKFPGYLAVYGAKPPDEEAGAEGEKAGDGEEPKDKNQEKLLPPLEPGMLLRLVQLVPEQHFTQPPPRFNESSLVKELEERGIGRPSTYAAILTTIQGIRDGAAQPEKAYVEKVDGRNFRPTHLGDLVTDLLVHSFPREMDVAFTAGMEEKLDEIEDGNAHWQAVLQDFYTGFKEDLAKAEVAMRDVKRQEIATDLACEKCGKAMVIKWGRMGEFLACSGYPECRNTMNFRREEDGRIAPVKEEEIVTDEKCPACGAPMVVKRGRFGRFLACSRYPECKTSRPISIGVTCPKGCGGYISERRSRRGKTFYGCSSYPSCDFVSWDRPRNEACPSCGGAYLLDKYSKKTGPFVACPNKECGYRRKEEGGVAGAAPQGERPPLPEEIDA